MSTESAVSTLDDDVGCESTRRFSKRPSDHPALLLFAAASLLSIPILVRMTAPGVASDILAHSEIARRSFDDGRWFSYTAYSPLLIAVSGNEHLMSLRLASIGILAVAVGLKVALAQRAVSAWGATRRASVLIAVSTFVVTPILALGHAVLNVAQYSLPPFGAIYLGRLSATVWHNSTMIVSLPFVVLAATFARRSFETPNRSTCAAAAGLIALTCLVKPNYSLAFLPVFIPAVVWRSRRACARPLGQSIGLGLLVGLPTVAVLAAQYTLTQSDPNIVQSRFAVDPMAVWSHYASSVPLAIAMSVAFPVLATAAVLEIRRTIPPWLLMSWVVFGVGLLQLAILSQRDRRTNELIWSGDWFWGPHTALLILILAAGAELSASTRRKDPVGSDRRWLPILAWVALALHALSGCAYIWRLFALQSGFAT